MMTGKQRWDYGTWLMNAKVDARKKQKRGARRPGPTDIFKYDVKERNNDYFSYNRNSGKVIFEVESYDEGRRVLDELYSA